MRMKCVIIFAALFGLSYQQTTHQPHHTHAPHASLAPHATHEPNVHEQFIFHYDYLTHKMFVISGHNCYIFTLSDQEKLDVHTDAGMTTLEAKLLPMLDSTTKTEVTKASLDMHSQQLCGKGALHFYTFA
ncbi:hypothetical protein CHS0354_014841 [Potamilus streckersoni]|uniref:Uncharacterized protein n=1 Tax=Potamilus streckersoni TaxID=2493646 RepID=A0AAE0VJ88_9BIVA|nr:hypothetical protein CHS0354_014841 [Potamilus streckersoni]